MRTVITILTIVIFLLGSSVVSYRYVETTTQHMGVLLESVENSITDHKWEQAQNVLSNAQQKWQNDNPKWGIILDHEVIDNINFNLKQLEKSIGLQDVSESISEVTTLKLQFEHIFDNELFTMKNIF